MPVPPLTHTCVADQNLRRTESLSDGVFFIATTPPVLNLRVPPAALLRTNYPQSHRNPSVYRPMTGLLLVSLPRSCP